MAFSCFIGVTMFCFALPEQLKMGPADIPALYQVAGTGWKFYVDEKSKLRRPAKPATLSQACNGTDCVSYWRKCDDAAHPKNCVWYVAAGEDLHSLTLIADDETKAGIAIAAVGVYARLPSGPLGQKLPPIIPLTDLKDEAAP